MISRVLTRLSRNSSRPSRQFTERTRMAARRRSLFAIEGLEDRTLLSNWIGADGGNWSDADNWDAGLPSATNPAVIDGSYTVNIDGDAVARSVTLLNGATLTGASGVSLEVRGGFSADAGSFSIDTVKLAGGGGRSINAGGNSFDNVVINVTDNGLLTFVGATEIDGDLTINNLSRYSAPGGISLSGNLASNDASFIGSGAITLVGDADQTINAGGESGLVPGLKFNKSVGSVAIDTTNPLNILGGWAVLEDNSASINTTDASIRFVGHGSRTIESGGLHFKDVHLGITDQGALTVDGPLSIDGDLSIGDNLKTILGDPITVLGNITTSSGTSSLGTGLITLAGNGHQTISSGDNGGALLGLAFQKTGGSVTIASGSKLNISRGLLVDQKTSIPFNASGSTIQFVGANSRTIDTGYASLGNVEININGQAAVTAEKMKVGGDLTIQAVQIINGPAGAITVGGDLTSNDASVAGNADITLTSGKSTTISGLDFPNGGININKGSNNITADVTQPLDGPLTINSVYYFSGSMAVGGNVTSNAGNAYASNGGKLVFQGGGNQVLTVAPGAHVPGVTIDKSGGNLTLDASNHDGTNPIGVTGNWDYQQGNFVVGDSKIVFLSGSKTINTGPLGSGMAFNDVEVRIGGGNLNAQNMVVGGDLTLTSVFYISGVITANGDVTTAANALASSTTNGKIEFVGAGDQTLSASSEYGGVPNVVVNKPGGKLFIAGPNTIDVGGNWTWTKGAVDANDSTVRFTAPANNINTGPGNGGMKFGNVVIAINSNTLKIENKLGVQGDLTINSVWAINAAPGAITVGGDLISNDSSVGGNADITMVVGKQTALLQGGDFPNGGIIINKGSSHKVHAEVTKPLTGPLTLQSVGTLTGELQVGSSKVTTNVGGVIGNSNGDPVLVFKGDKAQELVVTAPGRMVPGVKIDKTGGSFTLSDDLKVSGGWIVTGDNVAPVNLAADKTVQFQLHGGHGHRTIDTGASDGFQNVVINAGSASIVTIDAMVVRGELTLSSAPAINGGVITALGDVTTNSTTVGGSATILFTGSGEQTLKAGVPNGQVPSVKIDKSIFSKLTLDKSNPISVRGNWDYSGLGFNVKTADSTIRFTGGDKTIDSGLMVFNNVEFASGSASAVTIDGAMIVGGDLTINSLGLLNGGVITALGDVTTNDASVGGSATILFTGSGKQTLKAGVPNGQVPNVSILKLGGKLTLDDSNPIGVRGDWTYHGFGRDVDATNSKIRFMGGNKEIRSGLMVFYDVDFAVGSANKVEVLAPFGNSAGKLRYAGDATNTNKVTKGTVVQV